MKHPMAEINDGGPAFPVQDASSWQAHGLTVRDYFAGQAMQGMFAAFKHWPRNSEIDQVVDLSIQAADAMLKARAS